MPAVVTFTISALTAGTRVTYYAPNSLTPGPVSVNADAAGLVTLNLGNAVALVYLVTLPDGQWGHLPIRPGVGTIEVGTIPIYKNGVPPSLADISALFATAAGVRGDGVQYAASASGGENAVQTPNAQGELRNSNLTLISGEGEFDGDFTVNEDLTVGGNIVNTALMAALAAKQGVPLFGWLTTNQTVNDDEPAAITGLTVTLLANTYYDASMWLEADDTSNAPVTFTNGGTAVFTGSILSLLIDGADVTSDIVTDFASASVADTNAVQLTGRIKVSTGGTIQMKMVNASIGNAVTAAGSNVVFTPVGTFAP